MIRKVIGRLIWNTCETLNIDLGRFGPMVFGWMIGVRGQKVKEDTSGIVVKTEIQANFRQQGK